MARGRSKQDNTAHAYWIQTLNEARNNARQAITQAEAWGLSPETSVGPVDVEELSKPQQIMAQAHSYTLDYYDHLAPWRARHEEMWEETVYEGAGPTGKFEVIEESSKHSGTSVTREPELEEIKLALDDVEDWRMRIITVREADEPKRFKLYLPAGACHAVYNQLMKVQNQLEFAADAGPVIPHEEDVGVLTHDDVDYSDFPEVEDDYGQ
jgi:hypothetical protein